MREVDSSPYLSQSGRHRTTPGDLPGARPPSFRPQGIAYMKDGMGNEGQRRKAKKIAAALAAVEALLRDEAAVARKVILPAPQISSAWALSGRLALMNSRMPGGRRG